MPRRSKMQSEYKEKQDDAKGKLQKGSLVCDTGRLNFQAFA